MKKTKVFKCGNSMAVRLPKGFDLAGDEVEIIQRGRDIVLREIPANLGRAFKLLTELPDDCFDDDREDSPPQERDF